MLEIGTMASWGWDNALNPLTTTDASKDNLEADDKQLLRLTISQALQSQYVMEHTRGIDRFLSPKIFKEDSESRQQQQQRQESEGDDEENSLTSLVSTALKESKSRHLTAGFVIFSNGQKKESSLKIIIDCLGRELSAIGLASDLSFLSLTNKRSIILDRILFEYRREFRLKGMASLTKKSLPDSSHSLLKVTVNSAVFFILSMLESSAIGNPVLCIKILNFLQSQLTSIKPMELETNSDLPLPAIAENAFDSVCNSLNLMASTAGINKLIRNKCLELLLMLAVSRSTLSILLKVIQCLLFEFDAMDVFANNILLESIIAYRKMKRFMRLDLPNKANQILRASVLSAFGTSDSAKNYCSITTDFAGEYLFVHSSVALFKIGTGVNNTSPGSIKKMVPKYRSSDLKASIICIGDKLYYRSANIAKFCEAIVISTESLMEIGFIKQNGKGTVQTADNSHIQFGPKIASNSSDDDDESKMANEDEKETDSNANSAAAVRQRLRAIQNRIIELEDAGMDYDEIELLEMEYEDLFNSLPDDVQDLVEEIDDYNGSMSSMTINVPSSTSQATEKDKKKKKKSKIPMFNPLITDGRFMYAVVPEKPLIDATASAQQNKAQKQSENEDEEEEISHIYIRLNAFDPMTNLEHCNSLILKRPLPSENSEAVLDFNSPNPEKRKANQMKAASASTSNPYEYNPYGRRTKHRGKYHNTSCIDLGCPPQLNFAGSMTMECWFKFKDADMKKIGQELFYHGMSAYTLSPFLFGCLCVFEQKAMAIIGHICMCKAAQFMLDTMGRWDQPKEFAQYQM